MMRKAGTNPIPKAKVAEGLTNAEACALEIALIAKFGCHPHGPLANRTKGGDGGGLTEAALKKRNAAIKRALNTPEAKAKLSAAQAATWTPEKRAEHSKILRKASSNPEVRATRREAGLRAWAKDDGSRAAKAAVPRSAETQERHRVALVVAWQNPELRKKFERRFDPEVKARAAATLSATYSTPEWRERLAEAGRKGAAARWGKKS